jgi:hypothetical protein
MGRMDQISIAIRPSYADDECNAVLSSIDISKGGYWSIRFTQGEESFLLLDRDLSVSSFPIHHDVRSRIPGPDYLRAIRSFVSSVAESVPDLLSGLSYFFDSAEIMKPCFFKVYGSGEGLYLYLLRLDLSFRPQYARLLKRGDNDWTASYATRSVFFESDVIPLDSVESSGGSATAFIVRQLISQTWIGETGKGYMVRGIWIDADLSKFFTKLFLRPGKSTHPYYPLTCKYKTVCHSCAALGPEGRKDAIPPYTRALAFLTPVLPGIQSALKGRAFSETLPEFTSLRKRVPPDWLEPWSRLNLRPYLNDSDQKEYILET